MKNAFISIFVAASMLVAGAAHADNTAAAKSTRNMVTNGTFSAGHTGFTSDYVYADPSQPGYMQTPETQYEITNNVNLVRPDGAWGAGGGPEAGENFMVVNGSTSLNADSTFRNFWASILNLMPHASYKISFDFANLYPVSPANVVLTLDGAQQGSSYFGNGAQGAWSTETFVFNSGAGGPVNIGLADTNREFNGNDFAISNISVVAVPEASTWAMMILGVAMVGFAARRQRGATLVAA